MLNGEILFDAGGLTHVLDLKDQPKIGDVFVTHAHLDCITGIPFLAENLAMVNWKGEEWSDFVMVLLIKP